MPTTAERLEFNPYSWDFHEDPFPTYQRLRDEAPAYHNPDLGFWALSRYSDVLAALHDHETYCSRHGITLEERSPLPMMITMDPPEHTKNRRLISRAFTPRRVAGLEPRVRELANHYLDEICEQGECDLIRDFSGRLPMDVISEMLGIPPSDRQELRRQTDLMLLREHGKPEVTAEGDRAAQQLFEYLLSDVRNKRRNPGDDLVSGLLEAEIDGERLTDVELVAFCFLLMIAGNETTTKLIGNTLYWLTRFPGERRKLIDDPDVIPNAVEEVLRYEGSTQLMARTLTRDVTLHGQSMREGTRVLLLLGSANRDERVWGDDAERFDVGRKHPVQHLGFGHGIHVCLGAPLARLEMKVVLEEIHRRIPDYQVDLDRCSRMHSGNVRGYESMPMTFTPAPRMG